MLPSRGRRAPTRAASPPGPRSSPSRRRRWSAGTDRKSTRLNSSHSQISYAVFCLKKKTRGMFRNTRPDDMLARTLKAALTKCPGLDPAAVEDVIVGCAMPEAEQGMNVARIGLLLAGFPDSFSGMTVNRFCSSGFFFNDTATTEIYTLSLHDALPI